VALDLHLILYHSPSTGKTVRVLCSTPLLNKFRSFLFHLFILRLPLLHFHHHITLSSHFTTSFSPLFFPSPLLHIFILYFAYYTLHFIAYLHKIHSKVKFIFNMVFSIFHAYMSMQGLSCHARIKYSFCPYIAYPWDTIEAWSASIFNVS